MHLTCKFSRSACSTTARRRLRMTLWLFAVTPTFRPERTSAQIICAPMNVLPEPGGPWTGRTVSSNATTRRRARALDDSPSTVHGSPATSLGAAFSSRSRTARIRTVTVDLMPGDPGGDVEQRLGNRLRSHEVEEEHAIGVKTRRRCRLLDVDRASLQIEILNRADPDVPVEVDFCSRQLDLLRRKRVAMDGALLGPADVADEAQPVQR